MAESNKAGDIAIIGMAGRFPRADDVGGLWKLMREGAVGIRQFEVTAAGYVGAYGVLDDIYRFDAGAFGVSPGDAELLDPQHRQFAEVALLALEDSGIDPDSFQDIGMYASGAPSDYRAPGADDSSLSSRYAAMLANSPDFLATRISYLLGLRGESLGIQTGCSSSLVGVHVAVQSLLAGLTVAAVVGGVSISCRQYEGYLAQESMVASMSGACRPFDSGADGAVPGSGVGAVVLMRLDRAIEDGYAIRAVIEATAVNNDGRTKLGFMAPGPDGQAEVIATALRAAGVSASDIGFVQAHGTGTRLGDAVEMQALSRAFRLDTHAEGFCALGAVKANIGHLDRAAGIAGLIAAVLALEQREIPPMAGFERPNPDLKLESSPFYVPRQVREWPGDRPRAGVSSFGIGGTNAHVILRGAA